MNGEDEKPDLEAMRDAVAKLAKRGKGKAALVAEAEAEAAPAKPVRAEPDPEPDDLAALDAAWEEEEVIFGPGAQQDCGKEGLMAKLRHARRAAPGITAPPANGPRVSITTSPSHRN